jgi:heterodisulfide reductase subunit C
MFLLTRHGREPLDPSFAAEVRLASGQPVGLCNHCLVCAGGCPLAGRARPGPNGVLRLVQLGARRAALTADMVWFCTTCEACAVTCPNGIQIPRVMEALRAMAVASGAVSPRQREVAFNRAFRDEVLARGRMAELSLMARYKLAARDFFGDLGLGWRLLGRGKLNLGRPGMRRPEEVRRLFRAAAGGGR